MSTDEVAGYCPMGCGQTLTLDTRGHVTCSGATCPRPDAADELLTDPETEHIVELGAFNFSVQHPLRERLDGDLLQCTLHSWIADQPHPPEPPGNRYRVREPWDGGPWEKLP